jgi:hypothetical protein
MPKNQAAYSTMPFSIVLAQIGAEVILAKLATFGCLACL